MILEGLPPVTCVKAAIVSEGGGMRARKVASSKKRSGARPRVKVSTRKTATAGKKRVVAR